MRERARKSETVKSLEAKVGITDKTFTDIVSKGGATHTSAGLNPKITIYEGNNENEAIMDYAHELSNASAAKETLGIMKDARGGKIKTGDEYADKMIGVESEAVINHNLALMELGMENTKDAPEAVQLVKDFKDGKIDKKELSEKMFKMTKEQGVISDGQTKNPDGTPMKAYDYYKQQFEAIPKPKQ